MAGRSLLAGVALAAVVAGGAALAQGPAAAPSGRLSAQPRAAAEPARLTPADAIPSLDAAEAAKAAGAAPIFSEISAGGLVWTLGESALADVARAFGGQFAQGESGGAGVAWLCFAGMAAGKPSIFWFVSEGGAGGPDQLLTTIAVEPQDARGAGDCPPAPPGLSGIEAAIPAPGAKLAELRGALGEARPGPRGHVHYSARFPGAPSGATSQTAIYTGAGGKVVGLALTQVTTE